MIATVLALCGSTRSGSVNQKLLACACVALGKHDVTINSLDLHALDLPIYDADLEEERGQPEAVDRLRRAISQVDGLLIASPEYNHSITPLLKNAIDWVSHPIDRSPFKGKVAAIMSAAARPWGGTRMLPHLRDVLVDLGSGVIPPTVAVPTAQNAFDAEGNLVNPKTAAFVAKAMAVFAEELHTRAARKGSAQAVAQVELTN